MATRSSRSRTPSRDASQASQDAGHQDPPEGEVSDAETEIGARVAAQTSGGGGGAVEAPPPPLAPVIEEAAAPVAAQRIDVHLEPAQQAALIKEMAAPFTNLLADVKKLWTSQRRQ